MPFSSDWRFSVEWSISLHWLIEFPAQIILTYSDRVISGRYSSFPFCNHSAKIRRVQFRVHNNRTRHSAFVQEQRVQNNKRDNFSRSPRKRVQWVAPMSHWHRSAKRIYSSVMTVLSPQSIVCLVNTLPLSISTCWFANAIATQI